MDVNIGRWLLDFFIRQPIEDRTLTDLFRVLPVPSHDLELQKLLLLRKLDSDASRRSISEATLVLLEQLEEIEFRRGNEVSDLMKRAYCFVAMDCTLRHVTIVGGGDAERRFDFFEMVNSLWVRKVDEMRKGSEVCGLGSDMLWDCQDDMEDALWDDDVLKRVVQKFEGVRAAEAVGDYVREERKGLRRSFIERMAEYMRINDRFRRLMRDSGMPEVENHVPRVDDAPNGSSASTKWRVYERGPRRIWPLDEDSAHMEDKEEMESDLHDLIEDPDDSEGKD